MKNQPLRYSKALDLLFATTTLRENSNFFIKILILQTDKKTRGKVLQELNKIEEKRIRQQESILALLEGIEMNQNWKNVLFSYSNRVYKMMKSFHHKVLNISAKIAELSQINQLMQHFRNICIDKLAQIVHVKHFLTFLIDLLRKSSEKELSIFSNGSAAKVMQHFRKEQSAKLNRYLPLIRENGPDLYLSIQQRAQAKVDLQLNKISKESHPYFQYSSLMDLDEDVDPYSFSFQNGMTTTFTYLEQGLCEFIIGKWTRMMKEMKMKNDFNDKLINRFRQKYGQFQRKSKVSSSAKIHHRFSNIQFKEERQENQQKNMSIEMKDYPSYFEPKTPINNKSISDQQDIDSETKKMLIFKINKVESRKRSHTLRPLCESKENKEVVIHQKVMKMKLVEAAPQVIKNMRIRKRRPFQLAKDDCSWSVLMRDNQNPLKLAICIH